MSFLKIAWRNLRKNKGFSIINMMGLTLGLTCFFLLWGYIYHESNYDNFLSNANRIAYVNMEVKSNEEESFDNYRVTPTAVAPLLKREFPEVETAVRISSYYQAGLIEKEGNQIKEDKIRVVDPEFLTVFNYPVLAGDVKTPLQEPNSLVLTEAMADKYFPKENAIGKTMTIDKQDYKVTAIIETPPSHTEVKFNLLLSNTGLARYKEETWGAANDITYALLKTKATEKQLNDKINSYLPTVPGIKAAINLGYQFRITAIPLLDVHFSKKVGHGNIVYIYVFICLAMALLLISCINFTNLSLAHAFERGKEIGVKKVMGAQKNQLFFQFLTEGAFMVGISMLLALGLSYFIFPIFAQYLGLPMQLNLWTNPYFYAALLLFLIVVSLLASGWPAWVIARFNPVRVIKGNVAKSKSKFNLSNVLITFQYTVSIFLVICTFFAYKQMHFLQTTDTGLNRSQIVVLDGNLWNNQDRETLKKELLNRKSIQAVSASYDSPINIQGGYDINSVEGKAPNFSLSITAIPVEKDFRKLFEIPLLAGEDLSDADIIRSMDTSEARAYAFSINELAACKLGWTAEQAIGKSIQLNGRKGTIKAVLADFNFSSLQQAIQPVLLFPESYYFGNIFIKLNKGEDSRQALAEIATVWKTIKPNSPFESHFLDDDYADLYLQEQQTTKIMQLFALITVSIACIGLFALSTYAAQKRVKEIGIRKVLGASIHKIVALLTVDFILIVGIGFLLAVPLGFYAMHAWLGNFAYHTSLDWWVFLLAGLIIFVISTLSIASHAFRAASANPVNSLRNE